MKFNHDTKIERENNLKLVSFERKYYLPLDQYENYKNGKINISEYTEEYLDKKEDDKKKMEYEGFYLKKLFIKDYSQFLKRNTYSLNSISISNKDYNLILNEINEILEKKYNLGKLFTDKDFKNECLDYLNDEHEEKHYNDLKNDDFEIDDENEEYDYDYDYEYENDEENEYDNEYSDNNEYYD